MNQPNPHSFDKTHPFYAAWVRMRQRCYNPKSTQYEYYGGRGITVDSRWDIFENFYQDMWSTWRLGLTLDRKEVNGSYSKDNCRWATWQEQAENKRPYKIDVRNSSGVKGVYYSTVKGKWVAQAFVNRRRIHLYYGDSFDAACFAREDWEEANGKKL